MTRKYNEHVTVTKVKETYSILSNAVKMAEAEHGPADTWQFSRPYVGDELASYLLPYLKVQKICDETNSSNCVYPEYKNLGNNITTKQVAVFSCILQNGVSVNFWQENGTFSLTIDINALELPNQFGHDKFSFSKYAQGAFLIPAGAREVESLAGYSIKECCNYSGDSICGGDHAQNGKACTAWVIYKGNMDYLRRQVSWDE